MIKYHSDEAFDFFVFNHGKIITKKEYVEIVKAYNLAFMKECIENGTKMSIGGSLGHIQVVKKERRKRGVVAMHVNWPESNAIKNEILSRGEVPFESYRDDNGIVTGNNGGEKWLVYYTDPFTFIIEWIRHRPSPSVYRFFSFTPNKYPKRIMIPQFAKNNPERVKLIYPNDTKKGK